MHYIIQCHAKMLWTITPQDVFNLILEDTHSAFSGSANPGTGEQDEAMTASRRESRQSYRHLMLNLSSFRAVLQPLDTPYLFKIGEGDDSKTAKFAQVDLTPFKKNLGKQMLSKTNATSSVRPGQDPLNKP